MFHYFIVALITCSFQCRRVRLHIVPTKKVDANKQTSVSKPQLHHIIRKNADVDWPWTLNVLERRVQSQANVSVWWLVCARQSEKLHRSIQTSLQWNQRIKTFDRYEMQSHEKRTLRAPHYTALAYDEHPNECTHLCLKIVIESKLEQRKYVQLYFHKGFGKCCTAVLRYTTHENKTPRITSHQSQCACNTEDDGSTTSRRENERSMYKTSGTMIGVGKNYQRALLI